MNLEKQLALELVEMIGSCKPPADYEACYPQVIAKLRNYKTPAMRALESLVPCGSEFVDEPETCRQWIADRMTNLDRIAKNAIREKKLLSIVEMKGA